MQLILKVEKFIKRMQWKALASLGKIENEREQTYGFPTQKCPQTVDDLTNFEQHPYIMIKNIEFKFVSNNFQRQLTDCIKAINSSDNVFVSADKSRNIYKKVTAY